MKKLFAILLIALLSAGDAYSADRDEVKKVVNGIGQFLGGITSDKPQDSGRTRRLRDDGKLKAKSEIDGVLVKVKSCKADANDDVEIVFTLENTLDKDVKIALQPTYSIVYDDEGNTYEGSDMEFAKFKDPYKCSVYVTLPSGIPMKFKMKLSDIDSDATILKKVVMGGDPASWSRKTAIISNLPITREGDE